MVYHTRIIKVVIVRISVSISDSHVQRHLSHNMFQKYHIAATHSELNNERITTRGTGFAIFNDNNNNWEFVLYEAAINYLMQVKGQQLTRLRLAEKCRCFAGERRSSVEP